MFKFYYSSIEGLREFLENENPHSSHTQSHHYAVDICIAAINGNILKLIKLKKSKHLSNNEIETILIDKIIDQLLVNTFVTSIIRSYPVIPSKWLCSLMNEPTGTDGTYFKDKLVKHYGIPVERVNLNEDSTKFTFRIKK